MKLHSAVFLLAVLVPAGASAQGPGKPVLSGVPIEPSYLVASQDYTQVEDFEYACGEGTIIASWVEKSGEINLMAFPPTGEVHQRHLPLAVVDKVHIPLNAVAMVGGKPCVLYDRWDRGTGAVSLVLQRYTLPLLEEEGPEVVIGEISLSPESYHGSRLHFEVRHSPDGEKTLLFFDKIKQGGIKLALCWVVDNDLNILWNGVYRIPVQARDSQSECWLMNNGHVYLLAKALALEEGDLKESASGAPELKKERVSYNKNTYAWYELYGETFNHWEGAAKQNDLWPLQVGKRVYFAGFEYAENDTWHVKDAQWVVYDAHEDGLEPKRLAQGKLNGKHAAYYDGDEGRSRSWATTDNQGSTYITQIVKGGTAMVKLNADAQVEWEKLLNWDNALFFPRGDQLISYLYLEKGQGKKAVAGESFHGRGTVGQPLRRPYWMSLNHDGTSRTWAVLPADEKKDTYNYDALDVMRDCGCYIYRSKTKPKGLARVDLSE
jgi:hypothetical protein